MTGSSNKTILWSARIIGTLVALFFLYFLLVYVMGIGRDGMDLTSFDDIFIYAVFPAITFVGLSLAWKYEGIGAILTLAGNIALLIIRPELIGRIYLLIPILPAALFLIAAFQKRKAPSE